MPIQIDYQEHRVRPREGETVLDALLRQGVEMPFSCKGGVCHTCLLQCTEGRVEPSAQRGLPEHLQRMRYLLPCLCHPTGAMTLRPPQAQDLVTSKRAIKTSILAEHGQIIVLGGLISDDTSYVRQAVPGLGAIPGLGRLFRADGKSNKKRNLLIFIHPTIVGDAKDVRKMSQQRYSQLYSLQLALDQDGNFAKLPENVEDMYQPRVPVSKIPYSAGKAAYQAVPSGGAAVPAAATPVAIEPSPVKRQPAAAPNGARPAQAP